MTTRSPHGRLEAGASNATPDPEIMRRIAAGESSALGELYDRHCHANSSPRDRQEMCRD